MNGTCSEQTITCIVCPTGCEINVRSKNGEIERMEGYKCNRGKKYAEGEFLHPVRIFTSTVRLLGGMEPLLPVRSSKPIPKGKVFAFVALSRSISVRIPVRCGQIIVRNALGTGADIIATCDA